MLVQAKTLKGYKLRGLDGEIGSAREFYFDDRHWTIRYLVADTGNWLTGRKVLISPYSLNEVDMGAEEISVELTKAQIEASPSIDTDEPVSRQFEGDYFGYYGYPCYWGGPYMWGYDPYLERNRSKWAARPKTASEGDSHLRSTRAVMGYQIQAIDGEIGHVEDFIVEDESWAIRYLIVATTDFFPGKKVLVSPQWIDKISWEANEVSIGLSRQFLKDAPEYTDGALPTRDEETRLHSHYNREGYWAGDRQMV
jgi:hypothetical protein